MPNKNHEPRQNVVVENDIIPSTTDRDRACRGGLAETVLLDRFPGVGYTHVSELTDASAGQSSESVGSSEQSSSEIFTPDVYDNL